MKPEISAVKPSTAVRAEAAAWVARLHGSGRTRALEAGLRQWLKADPTHIRAFEVATEAWDIGGGVREGTMPRIADPFVDPPRTHVARRHVAMAAVVLLTVAGGSFLYWLRQEQAIATAVGEQRMLTLADGTRVFLNTDTRLFVREEPAQRRVELESGEALFDVARDPKRPFVVTAGEKTVVALGTSFVVRRDPQELVVTLMEGRVSVTPASADARQSMQGSGKPVAKDTTLTPGQRATFVGRMPPRLDEPSLEEVTAWRRGEVVLDRTRLQDAIDEMNRYSAVKLHIDDIQVADILVSGIFRAGDSVRFAHAVGETYHLSIEHERQRIVISRAPH